MEAPVTSLSDKTSVPVTSMSDKTAVPVTSLSDKTSVPVTSLSDKASVPVTTLSDKTSVPVTSLSGEIEVPEDPDPDDAEQDTRLWIGNLGSEITEYVILKLMKQFGPLRKMNFIYHKAGPDKGKPRGYCFVSFHSWESAEKARKALDGQVLMFRRLCVKWAQKIRKEETIIFPKCRSTKSSSSVEKPADPPPIVVAALSASSSLATASTAAKIKAIEAKLQIMEQTQKDFSVDSTIQPPPGLASQPPKPPPARSFRPAPYSKFNRSRRQHHSVYR